MIPTKTINLDFWRHPTDILHLVQGEADGRKVTFKITDNGATADLTGFIAIFAIKKPDGNIVVNSATITEAESGIVETTISSQVVTTAGNAHAELHLMKEGQLSKSFRIVTKVAPGVDIDGIAPSVSEFNALQTLIGQAETVISIADTDLWPEVVANAQYFSDLAGAGRTTETVKGNAERIDNLVATPVPTGEIIAQEIIDARQGEASLGANITEVKSLLAETTKEIFHSKSTDHNSRKAIMTFVDDDGRSEFYTKWKPIIENKNIPVTSALVTSNVGDSPTYLTISQIEELRDLGVEFVSHSHDHSNLGELTEAELRANFEASQEFLKQYDLVHDILVYPYGSQSILLRQVAREYFSCGVDILVGINVPPISTYRLNRKGWLEGGRVTLEDHKAVVDEVVANGGWLIWKTHSQYPEFTGDQLEWISEIIDYARNLGVEIVSVKEGLQKKGNPIDIGDIESSSWKNVAIVDSEGNAYGQNIGSHKFIAYSQSGVDINGDISQFAKNCKTVFQMESADVSGLGLPGGRAGLLEVYRGLSNAFGEQVYHQYRTALKYARYWNGSSWSDWLLLNPYAYLGTNGVDSNTPPTNDKLLSKFTSTFINTSGSTAGFPENSHGLLLTYANFTGSGFPRQEYTVHATNKKYTRYWNGTAWTGWVQLGGGSGSTANRPNNVHIGYMYFDTTLGTPVWWNGTGWVDANGE